MPKDVAPSVDPYAPTEPPPAPPADPHAPTQLPPEYLENPQIPKAPKVPEFAPEELGEQRPPTEIDPEKPGEGDSGQSVEDGDKPPDDDYDVEGWKKYYEKHPEVKRSAGAAGVDDPKMAEGAGEAGTGEGEAAADSPKEETEEPAGAPKLYTREDAARLIDESEGEVIDSSKPGAKGHAETHTGSREDEALDLLNRRGKTTMYRSRVQAEKDLRDFMNRHSEELDKLPPGGKLELSEPVNQPRNVYEAKPWEPNPDAATVVTKTVKQKLFVKIIKTDDGLHLRTMYLQE
jgi:hypothetical protein